MGLVWIDGFDHLTSSQMTRKYTSFSGNTASGSNTRFNYGQCLSFSSGSHTLYKAFSSTSQAWRIGYAFKYTGTGGSPFMMTIKDSTTLQCYLQLTAGKIEAFTGGFSSLGISANAMKPDTWYWVEWYVVIENSLSSGHFKVMVNNELWLSVTSGDTQGSANAYGDRFGIESGSLNCFYDDLVIYQESVTSTPTFDGEQRVYTLYPSGNGNYSQFTGSDADSTNNYLLVDEAQPNDDTDYVEDATVSDRDSYAFDNLPVSPSSISAVNVTTTNKKSDAGTKTGKVSVRISGTDYDSAAFSPSTSYSCSNYLTTVSPATSSAWTESEVNAMEAGIKVES